MFHDNHMSNISNKNLGISIFHIGLWMIFLIALVFAGLEIFQGDFNMNLLGFALKIDAISTLIFLMISLLGALIGKYSIRYLHGEKRQEYFYRYLFFTITSVSVMVLSGNLLLFFAMWFLSSLGLHKLLLYSPDRHQAVSAAWKKFYVSRFGDIALLLAIFLTYRLFGTLDFSELFITANGIADHSNEAHQLSYIGVLFVLGAMSKSAQFPFHFWLPETMETPAPVSALMHAGIINAGGFLMIRLSPLFQHAEIAHILLTIFGSITAVFGALSMITQNDIKKKLAYSTISQMGVMMVACGLGAYSLALFHIITHSFYKAHAFLSTGFLVEESKKVKFNHSKPSISFLILGAFTGYLFITLGAFSNESQYIAYLTYISILMLGFVQNIDFGEKSFLKMGTKFFVMLFSIFILSLGLCFIFELYIHEKLKPLTPLLWGEDRSSLLQIAACYVSYTIFVFGLGLSALLIESKGVFSHRLYLYFWNGGYFSQMSSVVFNRFHSKREVK